jgi:RNA polymerase sigma-32 factor
MAKKKKKKKTTKKAKVKKTKAKKKKSSAKKALPSVEIIEPELLPADSDQAKKTNDSPSLVPQDALGKYMAEVGKYPLLTREEEKALAIRYYEHGDRDAAERLVTSNLRFVIKVAMEYSKFGAKVIDLIQEGNVGLMQAVKEFNPYKGVRLITYAVWWIRGQIQEYLMRHYSMVRIGTTAKQRKLFYQLQRERDKLERMGFDAGIKQISGRLGIPEEEVTDMSKRVLKRDVSLDAPTLLNENSTMMELQEDVSVDNPDDAVALKEELHQLGETIEVLRPDLNQRELFVLDNRLLSDEPLTLQEIGNRYGITREAARQMEARLLKKIKEKML